MFQNNLPHDGNGRKWLTCFACVVIAACFCLSAIWSTQATSTDGHSRIQIHPQQHGRCAQESRITASGCALCIEFRLCFRQPSVTLPHSPISGSSSASVSPSPSRVPSPFSHPVTDQGQGSFACRGGERSAKFIFYSPGLKFKGIKKKT